MKIKTSIKRIVAFGLALSLGLVVMPQTTVYADRQKPVTGTNVTFDSSRGEDNYTYIVSWNAAVDSNLNDGQDSNIENVVDPVTKKTLFSYDVNFRAEGSSATEVLTTVTEQKDKYTYNVTKQLDKGKFYYHRVVANHEHINTETFEKSKASQDVAITSQPEAIFMSDLEFDITVEGREVTFEWSNPKNGNFSPFQRYSVFYSVSDNSGGSSINATAGNRIDIDTSKATLANGKLVYKYNMPDLLIGKFYSFKIEPVYNGKTLRGVVAGETPQSSIKINDKDYNIAYSKNEYRVDGIYVNPNLYVESLNAEFIRLYWDAFDASSIASTDKFKLELYADTALDEKGELTGNKRLIAVIEDINIISWIEEAPSVITYYQFVATSGTTVMKSNIAVYDQSYDKFAPYSPTIRTVTPSPTNDTYFNMTWDSFIRQPLGTEEANLTTPFDGLYEDKNIYYKVWITDSMSNFSNNNILDYFYNFNQSDTPLDAVKLASKQAKYLDAQGKTKDTLVYNSEDIGEFKNINQYVTYENGYPEMVALEENKVYYIKIQAFRKGVTEIASDSAYSSVYIPSKGNIVTTPETLQRPPLRIQKDETGAEVVTESTIAIEWDKTWFEVSDEKEPSTWYSVIGVNESGTVVFGERNVSSITDTSKILNLSEYHSADQVSSIRARLNSMGVTNYDTIPIRFVDYTNSGSQIHVVEYDSVSDYEEYLASLDLEADFQDISPVANDTTFSYVVSGTTAGGSLEPDTSYLIIVRSYFTYNGVRYYTYMPQYVVGSTVSTVTEIPEIPTAPIIEPVSSTDTSVTVRYITNDLYTNELRITNIKGDYSDGGEPILNEVLRATGKTEAIPNSNEYYVYYTVENLFPDTTYYLWINNTAGKNTSAWSTAIDIRTKPLIGPAVPTGLSIISSDVLDNINAANGLDYKPVEENSLILEWARIYKDTETKTEWVTPYGIHEVLQDINTQRFVSGKFNKLIAFKDYYARVRTILTVQRNGLGANVFYSYELQLSQYPDFLDKSTIIAYDKGLVADNIDILSITSDWSKVYTFKTSKDYDEYDGFNDPDKFPLPDSNFEIKFDNTTGTLEYIFRSSGVDSTGAGNNLVDQRFISELASNGNYDFSIDLTNYNYEDVKKRKVTIPYSILNTFDTYETTLTVKNDNLLVTYNFSDFSDFLKSQNIKDYGVNTSVALIANEVPTLSSYIKPSQSIESDGHDLSLVVTTPLGTKELQKLSSDMDMALILKSKASVVDNNVSAYTLNNTPSTLSMVKSTYNKERGTLDFKSKNLDTYVGLMNVSAITTGSANQKDYYYNIANDLVITDISDFSGTSTVNATQINNLISAIVKDKSELALNTSLSNDDYTNLGRSGLLVSGSTVSREAGISAILKLYEKETGQRVALTGKVSDVPNISTVSEANKNNIAKAYELALFDDSKGYNYSNSLTYDELFYMVDLVLTDKK